MGDRDRRLAAFVSGVLSTLSALALLGAFFWAWQQSFQSMLAAAALVVIFLVASAIFWMSADDR